MSDNLTTQSATPATVPASSIIATDDAGAGGHVQVVKLAVSTNGSATPLTADNTDGLLVNLGTNNDVSVTGSVTVTDGSGSLTVDGTVAATQSGTWTVQPGNTANTTAWKVDGSAVTQPVSGTVAVTGVATAANQSTANTALSAIQTAVEALDNTVAGNELQVDVLTMPTVTVNAHAVTNAGTFPVQVDNTVTVASHAVTNAGTFATQVDGAALTALQLIDNLAVSVDGNYLNVNMNVAGTDVVSGSGTATGALRVELPTNGTGVIATVGAVTAITNALPAGTNGIGKLTANSGVDIGDVDILSIAAGNNNIGDVDIATIAAGDNNIGNVDVVTLPATPAGTNAIGKLLPPDIDVTTHTVYAKKYYTNAGAVTDGIVWSPASGTRWHVVSMYINTSAAAVITLEDDKAGGDEAVWKGEFAANSGMTIHFGEMYPLASGEDAADLIITTSAGNVYVTITGYEK